MSVATKLRLASGVVIVVLVAILAVALYVPTRLSTSANEKYGNEAIPFQRDVQALVRQMTEQKALADRYSLTLDPSVEEDYFNAGVSVSDTPPALTRMATACPSWIDSSLTRQVGEVDGELIRQMDEARTNDTPGVLAAQRRVDRRFARFGEPPT